MEVKNSYECEFIHVDIVGVCVQCIERMNAKKRTNEQSNEKKCAYNF